MGGMLVVRRRQAWQGAEVVVLHPAPGRALQVPFRWPVGAEFLMLGVHNCGMTGAELQEVAAIVAEMAEQSTMAPEQSLILVVGGDWNFLAIGTRCYDFGAPQREARLPRAVLAGQRQLGAALCRVIGLGAA